MRVKRMTKVHNLRHEIQEEYPDSSYISRTTTYRAKKGRFLGFDMGNGLQVGVFSPANSNIANIVVRGDQTDREEEVTHVVNKLTGLGFCQF